MAKPAPSDPAPLEDIAYLARSENRVTALARLAEGPMTRRELHEATGISQPTLGRLLNGFDGRGWASRDRANGRTYALTPLGELVTDALGELLASVETMQQLRAVADGLPLAEMDFDLRRFADATITVPNESDAMAHLRREDQLIVDADRVRFLCTSAYAPSIKAYRDRFVGGDQAFEAVITGEALDAAAADPETARWVRELAAADGVTIYRYEGPVSVMLGLIDEVASIVPLDDSGVPCAFIESTDPEVRDWVVRELDRHEAAADAFEPEAAAEPTAND